MTSFDLDGKWGIIHSSKNIPIERWDSFRTISKHELKIGHNSHICPGRSNRPLEWSVNNEDQLTFSKSVKDSFCCIMDGKEPAIVIAEDDNIVNDPYSNSPEQRNYRHRKAITFINLYSPTGRNILADTSTAGDNPQFSLGIPLVHSLTDHYNSVEEVPRDQLATFLKNVAISQSTCESSIRKKHGSKADIQIIHFYNIGPFAGASIPHLHAQSWIYLKKGYGWKDHSFLEAFENHKRLLKDPFYCLACEYTRDTEKDAFGQTLNTRDRRVYQNDNWQVLAEFAPERDGHLRIFPFRHFSRLSEATDSEILSLADTLIVANRALSLFISELANESFNLRNDRNMLFRTGYLTGNRTHLLIDIIPVQSTGGAELFDDHRISHIFPEETAKKMRELLRNA